jgi:hypothetical protein
MESTTTPMTRLSTAQLVSTAQLDITIKTMKND